MTKEKRPETVWTIIRKPGSPFDGIQIASPQKITPHIQELRKIAQHLVDSAPPIPRVKPKDK